MIDNPSPTRRSVVIQSLWFEGGLLLRILMQTIWITVWYQSLMGQRVSWPVAGLIIFLALFVSTLLVRVFGIRQDWRPGLRPAIFGAWMIMFLLASLKLLLWSDAGIGFFQTIPYMIRSFGEFPFDLGLLWHLMLVPILIWQGVNLGNSRGSLSDTIQGFKVGILLMLLHGLIFMPQINLPNSLPWIAFLVLGLLATSINRMADLIPLRGGRLPTSSGIWWAAIFGVAVLVTSLSLAAGGSLHSVVRIGVFAAIGLILLPSGLILMGLAFLIYLVVTWLNPQFTLSAGQLLDTLGRPLAALLENERLLKNLQKTGRHTIDEYLIPAVIALVVIVVVIFIFVDIKSRRSWIRRTLSEENVSDIMDRFKSRSRRKSDVASEKSAWRAGRFLAAARIRVIYSNLLELAAKVGSPRPPALTPLEYLPVLGAIFPDHADNTRLITQSYLKIRYGGFPESAREVEEVETAWKSLQAQGRRMILAKKREDRENSRS